MMDPNGLNLQWVEEVVHHEEICGVEEIEIHEGDVLGACEEVCQEVCIDGEVHEETIIHTTDDLGTNTNMILMQQNNDMETMYISQDQTHDNLGIEFAEEVIINNWDRSGPDEGIPQTKVSHDNLLEYDDSEVPLQSEQDAAISSRPFPCDFCSRRFSKKANLMNHMVSHQTDRPYSCNFCEASYIRKCDLANHRKTHATIDVIDNDNYDDADLLNDIDMDVADDDNNLIPDKRKKQQTTTRKRKYTTKNTSPKRNYTINESKNNLKLYNYNDIINIDNTKMNNKYKTTTLTGTAPSSSSKWNDEIATQEQTIRWPIIDTTKPYVCQVCGLGCAREKALKSHMKSHDNTQVYLCTNCGEKFTSANHLNEHARIKHGVNNDDDDDDNNVIDNDDIQNNYIQHVCKICGAMFQRYELLKRHSKKHIKQEYNDTSQLDTLQFTCTICGDLFDDELTLSMHTDLHNNQNSQSRNHKCFVCGDGFSEIDEVSEHVRNFHSNIPPNSCDKCGKSCKDKRSLTKHLLVHSNEKVFPCNQCDKNFISKARLRRHKISHEKKTVSCEECGIEFENGRALVSHKHSHKDNGNGRTFPCIYCVKTFGSRSSQQIHVRIHTGDKPYKCNYCQKGFADGGTLRKHERIHTGEKPYGCSICSRAFNQRVVLREHVRAHHSQPDPNHQGTITPYYCKVCSSLFSKQDEIIQHIIKHCDDKTAENRQPHIGPRKYKRRRKTTTDPVFLATTTTTSSSSTTLTYSKPSSSINNYHINNNNNNNNSNDDDDDKDYLLDNDNNYLNNKYSNNLIDGTSDSEENTKRKLGKRNKKQQRNIIEQEGYENVLKSFESSINNIDEIVGNSKLTSNKNKYKKLKLKNNNNSNNNNNINSSNCNKIINDDNINNNINNKFSDIPLKNQSGRPKMIHTQKTRVPVDIGTEGVKKGQKTKTMVTRTPRVMPNEHKSGIFPGGERNRPRTKNVSCHADGRIQIVPAVFSKNNHINNNNNNNDSDDDDDDKKNSNQKTTISNKLKLSSPPTATFSATTTSSTVPVNLLDNIHIKTEPHISTRRSTAAAAAAAAAAVSASTTTLNNSNLNIKTEPKKKTIKKIKKQLKTTNIKQEPFENNDEQINDEQINNNNHNNSNDDINDINDINNINNINDDNLSRLQDGIDDTIMNTNDNNTDIGFNENIVVVNDVEREEIILPDLQNVNHEEEIVTRDGKQHITPQSLLCSNINIPDDNVITETIVPESVDYPCGMCGSIFSSHSELSAHVIIHI